MRPIPRIKRLISESIHPFKESSENDGLTLGYGAIKIADLSFHISRLKLSCFSVACTRLYTPLCPSVGWLVSPFLGSGPEGADDLCFYTGEIFPSASSSPPSTPLEAHILALEP